MGFKTKILPAIEVLRADGIRCLGFERKPMANGLTPSAGVLEA